MAQRHGVARAGAVLVLGAAFVAAPSTGPLAAGNEATVSIVALRFTPDPLEISTGTVVVWQNKELTDYPVLRGVHKVVADDGTFASGEIWPEARFSHRFLLPGTFAYHCDMGHPLMTGTVVVTGEPIHEPTSFEVAIRETSPGDPESWGFAPSDITIEEGDLVTWRNDGSSAHTATADDETFDSGEIDPGSTFERTFESAGVYRYHCTPHPWMEAVVRVASPGEDPPTEPSEPPDRKPPSGSTSPGGRVVASDPVSGPIRLPMRIVAPDPASPFS